MSHFVAKLEAVEADDSHADKDAKDGEQPTEVNTERGPTFVLTVTAVFSPLMYFLFHIPYLYKQSVKFMGFHPQP